MQHSRRDIRKIVSRAVLSAAVCMNLALAACSSGGDDDETGTNNGGAGAGAAAGSIVASSSTDTPAALGAASNTVLLDYTMDSVNGGTTTARALLFEPTGDAPADGHALVVWAHGTTGISNACTPSDAPDNLLNLDAIDSLLAAGYAVLAPDYEGFGTPSLHPYYVRDSHANAVLSAVAAAHEIEGSTLSDDWAIVGHSQGGHVALSTARATQLEAFPLAAVAALAPGTDLRGISDTAFAAVDADVAEGDLQAAFTRAFFLIVNGGFVAHGFDQVLPDLDPQELFEGEAANLIDIATTEQTCGEFANAVADAVNDHAANGGTVEAFGGLRRDWFNTPGVSELLESEMLNDEAQAAPLLVVQGTSDLQIPVAATDAFVTTQMNLGTDVTYEVITDGNHSDVARDDFQITLDWLATRFPAQ